MNLATLQARVRDIEARLTLLQANRHGLDREIIQALDEWQITTDAVERENIRLAQKEAKP